MFARVTDIFYDMCCLFIHSQ